MNHESGHTIPQKETSFTPIFFKCIQRLITEPITVFLNKWIRITVLHNKFWRHIFQIQIWVEHENANLFPLLIEFVLNYFSFWKNGKKIAIFSSCYFHEWKSYYKTLFAPKNCSLSINNLLNTTADFFGAWSGCYLQEYCRFYGVINRSLVTNAQVDQKW